MEQDRSESQSLRPDNLTIKNDILKNSNAMIVT